MRPRALLLVLIAGVLGASSNVPDIGQHSAGEFTVSVQADTPFTPIETSIRPQDGPDATGFMLLDSNEPGLTWRLPLIDSAKHPVDLQHYACFGNASGVLLMKHVGQAAKRGVKVRITVDDLSSMLRDMTTPEVRDSLAAATNAFPISRSGSSTPGGIARSWALRRIRLPTSNADLPVYNKVMIAD